MPPEQTTPPPPPPVSQQPPPPPEAEIPPSPPAWEGSGSWPGRFLVTARQMLFSPRQTMAAPAREVGLGLPLAFGLLAGTVGTWFQKGWSLAYLRWQAQSGVEEAAARTAQSGWEGFVGAPLVVLIALVALTLFYHLGLMVARVARPQDWRLTFRVVAYVQAAALCSVLPFVGALVTFFWMLAITVGGLAGAHRAPLGKTAVGFAGGALLTVLAGALYWQARLALGW
ncbi:MAG: YIP1 family protein [Deltaproteobacteria bacterium]|nr:YIP1 family protein [Deltaproteobacteria bacterium]